MKNLTHIVGTFLIQAEGSFLNGGGKLAGEHENNTGLKTFNSLNGKIPYVSAQAWRRWLRNTYHEENPNQPCTELKAIGQNTKGNTNKIGTENDPITYAEDDIFGYMKTEKSHGKKTKKEEDIENNNETDEQLNIKVSLMRTSPFSSSILKSIRNKNWRGIDEAYVHLKEGSSQPYNIEFMNTQLEAIFSLNYARLGIFKNEGDRIELDEKYIKLYADKIKEIDTTRKIYEIVNNPRKERASAILRSLAVMRGGAKQSQFATDVSPKVLVIMGLNCGNPILNNLFEDTQSGTKIKIATLEEIITEYTDRIVVPIHIGIRTGYLTNEEELKTWASKKSIIVSTPREVVEKLLEKL